MSQELHLPLEEEGGGGGGGGGGRAFGSPEIGNDGLTSPDLAGGSGGQMELPCGIVAPTNPDQLAVAAMLLGEATPQNLKGTRMYGIDQSGSIKNIGAPNGGVIDEGILLAEMIAMVSVIENRRQDGRFGSSWGKIASNTNQFIGYKEGNDILSDGKFAANHPAGSAICHQLYLAELAIKTVIEEGPSVPKSVLYWKAVRQENFIRPFRPGIDFVRLGYTDFSTQN